MSDEAQSGKLYAEICNGFSVEQIANATVYFKHLSIAEYFDGIQNYDNYVIKAESMGLQKEADKIKHSIEEKWWPAQNEEKIALLKATGKNLLKTKEKLLYPSQKQAIDIQIKKNNFILMSYLKERSSIVGYTAEEYADSKSNEDLLKQYVFIDKDLTKTLFQNDDIENCNDEYLDEIKKKFFSFTEKFSDKNIKLTAASGFFQNLIFLEESPYNFWGKPLFKCSRFQSNLILYGRIYRNFIKNRAEINKPVPDEIASDPEKLIQFVEAQNNNKNYKNFGTSRNNRTGNVVSSHVGATSDDLNQMGVRVEKLQGKSLLQLAKENGGIIEKNDYLNARESS